MFRETGTGLRHAWLMANDPEAFPQALQAEDCHDVPVWHAWMGPHPELDELAGLVVGPTRRGARSTFQLDDRIPMTWLTTWTVEPTYEQKQAAYAKRHLA